MAKLTLADVSTTGDGLRTLINSFNDNMALIESAMENTLSRNGATPNYMDAGIDMNGYRITNLPTAVNNTEPVTLAQAGSIIGTTALTQAGIGAYLWPQTTLELANGVTPTYLYYPPGDVRRYGAAGDGTTDDYIPLQAALDSGHTVVFEQNKTYYITVGLTWELDYGVIEGNRATIATDQDITPMTIGPVGGTTNTLQRDAMIRGFLKVQYTGTYGTSTKPGWLFQQCQHSLYEIAADSFYTNVKLAPTEAGNVYNEYKFGYLRKPSYVNLHLIPTAPGWCNENRFMGGRFSIDGVTAAYAHIWVQGSGSGNGWPNNNVFFHNSLEGSGNVEWAIVDEGLCSRWIQPRLEITCNNTVPNIGSSKHEIYITAEADGCLIDTGWYDMIIYDLGKNTIQRTLNHNKIPVRGGNVGLYGGPALRITRQQAGVAESSGGSPLLSVEDIYEGSGTTQGIRSVGSRGGVTGSYHIKCQDSGDPVSHLGRHWECIASHTAASTDEPGTGANWRLYWQLKDTIAGTAPAWALTTAYTGRTNQFMIKGDGDICTNQATANTNTPAGATAYKLAIHDKDGTLIGYIPVYAAAW